MALFVFLLAVYGLATAIAVLKIGKFIFGDGYCAEDGCPDPRHPTDRRKLLGRIPYLGDLFYCPPCLSFWIGMACSAYVISPSRAVCAVWWQAMVLDGLMACGASWILFVTTERLAKDLEL